MFKLPKQFEGERGCLYVSPHMSDLCVPGRPGRRKCGISFCLQAPMPKSGIDLVLLFDLPDDVALRRAEGRTCKDF